MTKNKIWKSKPLLSLYVGCGGKYLQGYINIEVLFIFNKAEVVKIFFTEYKAIFREII